MDYSKLRAAALKSSEDEEAVTVDTRALIDKVLARYSGEWTTLRELIQNAADAQATTVTIRWETLPSTTVPLPHGANRSELLKHTIANHTLRRLVVQNDGQPFTQTDWGRLKRIAEGNPDETKIGAFGVGFYSVFADCEEPFVSSGDQAMAFYWKGNALFTRKMQIPADQATSDTAFVLDYRNTTTPLPNLLSVGQFLATSLTFVALQNIEFWVDDYKLLALKKKTSPSIDVPIPRDLETRTQEGLMNISGVGRVSTQIDAGIMSVIGWKPQVAAAAAKASEAYGFGSSDMTAIKGFFSRFTSSSAQSTARAKAAKEEKAAQEAIAEDLTVVSSSSIFLRVTTATIETKVASNFAKELERATKKPPPKTTKMAILTSSYDETMASESSSRATATAKAADVFATVLPSRKPGGRVFIGFPTGQTTGAGMHISAPSVIPTVEREAIDLNARWVRNWNIEMLRVAGIVTRLAFSNDMADLDAKLRALVAANGKGPKPTPADVAKFMPEALHILNTYTFSDSTPSSHVGRIIEEAFWTAYRKAYIDVYSSQGVLPTTKVRIKSDALATFVDGIPVISDEMKESQFVKKLQEFGLLKSITIDDVRQELEAKALNKEQLMHFVQWISNSAAAGDLDPPSVRSLLDVAVATVGEGDDQGSIIALSTIKNYLTTNKIPVQLPIPPTTIPFVFTSKAKESNLGSLGWSQLDIVPWLKFLIDSAARCPDDQNLTKSPAFAQQVLTVLSKNWAETNASDKSVIATSLQSITVVPTKMGMRKPTESFFPSVKLFDDLPTLTDNHSLKEKFLSAIGVRKTVDLDTIFTRLLSQPSNSAENGRPRWSHVELIKYLASVRADIPATDMKKLKESRICPAEAGPKGMESTKPTSQLFKVSELFEPQEPLRTLGLPLLQWPGPPGSYRKGSPEGLFLVSLGLRSAPSVAELLEMMADKDPTVRKNSMSYFISNHHTNGYASFNIGGFNKPILPLMGKMDTLVTPSACYTNERAAILGFNILAQGLHPHAPKFGVARDPPIMECVNRLIANPPQDQQSAAPLFEYFTSRLGDVGENSLAKLRDASIVPVVRHTPGTSKKLGAAATSTLAKPVNVYLGISTTYGDIFDFVDFGANANTFLLKCGAKLEPTKLEIAKLACNEPARLLSILQSSERYLNLLRFLAEDWGALKKDKELFRKMKSSPFLLACREIPSPNGSKEADNGEDETSIRQFQLAAPKDIVILDDFISYNLFKTSLLWAPEDDKLESFYQALGAQVLSHLVQEDIRVGPHVDRQDASSWLHKHVLERSKLFLHEYAKYKQDAIKHDAKWLEKNLRVEVVRNISLRRSLQGRGQSHTEKRTAAGTKEGFGFVLYIAAEGRPDMYQVGQAVCHALLNRPNQQAYFFFEPFLRLDLLDLRARGYNVDRILRVKAQEARIAEEERRKALEDEQRRIQEREREWRQQEHQQTAVATASREGAKSPQHNMPGAFGDDSSPESSPVKALPPPESTKKRSLFSQLSKKFGLDHDHDHNEKHQAEVPPPGGTGQAGPSTGPSTGKPPAGEDGRVTSPAVVQQNLLNAVKATRAHGSSSLFSPPKTTEVKEQATYCDSTAASNLVFAADAPNGMRVFVARELSIQPHEFLSSNIGPIAMFETVLRDVANIYSLSTSSVHIFYDEKGPTIAFNSSGSIFCNLRYFKQLHADKLQTSNPQAEDKVDVTVWWWVVLAHELAHNIETTHNANHSYYTESFVQQYFPRMMTMATSWDGKGSRSNGTAVAPGSSQAPLPQPPPPPYQQYGGRPPNNLLD
ncbi:uncharacterized protein E0L32_008113 [Thyridium curvatum]|uniref:Sacsin/Nov domain-containing protein n=1 Tax=Thyridium curvatum TaxID=1093900 RepID=A0A507ATV9_9PEZI|nr:uncharacterized protein E0L32_008113 [Thyridium curvatum]TPX10907.1 hypothetical protein E0L32_008113 [Thyridium curvatum]